MGVLSPDKVNELRKAAISERGNRLDMAIRLSRLTQKHIGSSLHVPQIFISNLKMGKRRRLSVDLANKFAAYFGCDAADLFPPEHIVLELVAGPDLPRPVERPRSPYAGTKRPKRAPRKRPDFLYPLPPHLDKQCGALFEMLTDARLAQGLTLQEVADRLNRTRQQIEQWESAVRHLRVDTFMEWADALGFRLCLEPARPAEAFAHSVRPG